MRPNHKRCGSALVLAIIVLAGSVGAGPVVAASKYDACSLLTASEVEMVVGQKITNTHESDVTIAEGLWKGETMSSCSWIAGQGQGTIQTSLNIIRGPRTPEERAAGLATLRQAEEALKKQGWSYDRKIIGGVECSTGQPPAGAANLPLLVGCAVEKGGRAFSLGIMGIGAQVSPEQVKALADKAAGRLR